MRQNSQQRLNVEVVCSQNNFKEHFLIDSDEFLVPFTDFRRTFASIVLVLVSIC